MERFLEVLLGGLAARGIAIHVLARILDAVPAGSNGGADRLARRAPCARSGQRSGGRRHSAQRAV